MEYYESSQSTRANEKFTSFYMRGNSLDRAPVCADEVNLDIPLAFSSGYLYDL